MSTKSADQIRDEFIEFFKGKEHTFVPSSPVVPLDDPTLMFTNAGMNQFKDVFLGMGARPYRRAANTQKCIRAGGKHNDLDDVGHDTYHHTFFEMLGNWSFGDYFKKEAIGWAWELLTKVWGIDKRRLHATYFQGDEHEGLEPDAEARDLWASITDIDPTHIHPGNKKDNFWEMGDTGPCGPCSEIHIDLTPDMSGGGLVNAGDSRVMEIWNLVFIQYNRGADGKLSPLPARHVDTGMGFERICAVLRGMETDRLGQVSNYDTDVFAPIFAGIQRITGAAAYTGLLESHADAQQSRDREGADPRGCDLKGAGQQSRDREGADLRSRGTEGTPHTRAASSAPRRSNPPLAYFITFHTYGTWLHGRASGSVDRDHRTFDTPFIDQDEQREREQFVRLKREPVLLDESRRAVVDQTIREVCRHRGWQLHELNVRTNHVHVVVTADVVPEKIMNDLKAYATRRMVEAGVFPTETKAWTRHGSTRYLWTTDKVEEACRYVREGQGAGLAAGGDEAAAVCENHEEPLPYGRGSAEPEEPLPYGRGSAERDAVMKDIAYRVIADHVRCLTFALADGAVPSNEGRGYVLRRILRRAVRYGRQYLGVHEPFLCKLVPVVVEAMGHAFPELKDKPQRVAELVREEEESFIKTLDRGIKLFADEAEFARLQGSKLLSGGVAFTLHATYGFPIDLTVLMCQELGLTVDIEEYERQMEEARQKSRVRASRDVTSDIGGSLWRALAVQSQFVGYDNLECDAYVLGTVATEKDVSFGTTLYAGQQGILVLDKTPFYAEKGGQVGDVGSIISPSGEFAVEDTREIDGFVAHIGRCVYGEIHQFNKLAANQSLPEELDTQSAETWSGIPLSSLPEDLRKQIRETREHHIRIERGRREPVRAVVSESRRLTMHNHTATHILNWSLREVLELGGGGKVDQKGSLVDPDKTRFDFSHNKPLTAEEIERIEALCNEQIKADRPVYTKEVPEQEARKINTLRAVFGEKYPEMVRVVSVGADIDAMLADPQNPKWMKHPVEFCGGTHVPRTGEIEAFVLTAEEAVAKGVRRVVGITGEKARQVIETGRQLLEQAAAIKAGPADQAACGLADLQKQLAECEIPVRDRIALRGVIAELQQLAKRQSKQQAARTAGTLSGVRQEMLDKAERVNGTAVVVGELPAAAVEQLRETADWLRTQAGSAAVCLAVTLDGKPMLVAAMTEDLVKRGLKAGELIRHVVPAIDGRGGGKPDLAQAGGKKAEGIPDALSAATEWIRERLR